MKSEKFDTRLFLCLAVCTALPYLLFGFRYFPVLDDYIQYGCYPTYGDLSYVYFNIGTLATRPLAHLLDPALWGRFWPMMGVALFLITALHLFSAMLFYKTLKHFNITMSPIFLLIYLLLPLGMEGRFWLSASTRLIPGLFFAALSLWFLGLFLVKQQSPKFFLPFAFFQLISCGFYESVAVFSVTASVLLFLLVFSQNRKLPLFLVPATSVFNIGMMFFYYQLFAGLGLQGSRADGFDLSALPAHVFSLFRQLEEIFSLFYAALFKGSAAGMGILIKNGLWGLMLLLLAVMLCLLLCRFSGKGQKQSLRRILCLECAGLTLFFAPLVPNIITADVWITNRSMFVSVIGLAFMAEPLWAALKNPVLRRVVLFMLSFLCITAAVNEYDVYRRANELDTKLLEEVVSQLDDEVLAGEKDVVVLLSGEILVSQNAFYKDHVKSVFDSDWALTGALRAKTKNLLLHCATPVLPGQSYETEKAQVIEIKNPE